MNKNLWLDTFYLENFGLILGFLVLLAVPLYFLKDTKTQFQASWASVISWLYAIPILYFFIGIKEPGPLIFLTLVSIYSAKTFLQMVGIYHRHVFVYLIYAGIILCSVGVHYKNDLILLMSPLLMIFLFCMVPIFKNNTKNMIQYISVAFVCFVLFGWSVIFSGKILSLPMGAYLLLYLYILCEFSGNATNMISMLIPSPMVASQVTSKAKWSGLIVSFVLTLTLAWAFRRMLFNNDEVYWVSAGIICFFSSHFGEWTISVFRKDLGIKDHGVFIIGRSDLLSRTNRIIFSYPAFTFLLWILGDLSFKV